MARRGHRSRSVPSADITHNASDPLAELLELAEPDPVPLNPVTSLDDFMQPAIPFDGRVFSFGQEQPFHQEVANAQPVRGVSSQALSPGIRVAEPQALAVCVRRKERREVLHAFRLVGRGRGGGRRWNENSKIKCK